MSTTGAETLDAVRGLRDCWTRLTRAGPTARRVPLRPLLYTLGLALEQTLTELGRREPDWSDFTAWIVAVAGEPDPAAVARYNAWYDGLPLPVAERARQAALLAAGPVFSDGEMRAWHRDGVIVLHRAIDRDAAAAIADHLYVLQRASADDPASWYHRGGNGIMVQSFQHATMAVPRRSARIHRAFAQLYGHADLLVSTDRLSFNPPVTKIYAFPGPELHWDTSLTLPIPFETQGILYLTDTAADQGALRVVKGFHHRLANGWLDTLDGRDPRGVDLSAHATPIAAAAGDLVIWRQDLPHGASPNTATRPRLAQYLTMAPMRWPDDRPWR